MRRGRAAEGNDITHKILGAAFMVHTALGPGLLESAYESCLAFELTRRGMTVERQKTLPVQYGNIQVDAGYRIDLLVDDSVIVEVKSVREVAPIHQAQLDVPDTVQQNRGTSPELQRCSPQGGWHLSDGQWPSR